MLKPTSGYKSSNFKVRQHALYISQTLYAQRISKSGKNASLTIHPALILSSSAQVPWLIFKETTSILFISLTRVPLSFLDLCPSSQRFLFLFYMLFFCIDFSSKVPHFSSNNCPYSPHTSPTSFS